MLNQKNSKLNKKVWGAALLMAIFVGVMISTYNSTRFSVASTNPNAKQMTTWTPFFKISFTGNLSSRGLLVSTSPKQSIYNNQVYVSGDTLTINLSVPLNPKQTYKITINNIADTSGATIKNKIFSFTPKPVTFSQITDNSQQEALMLRNEESPIYRDPLLKKLPYNTLSYNLIPYITTSSQNNLPVINIKAELLLNESQASSQASETAAVSQDKESIQAYIRSFNLNPNNYNIIYSVSLP